MDEATIEQLEAWYKGTMNEEEYLAFEQALQQSPDLRRQLHEYILFRQTLHDAFIKETLQQQHAELAANALQQKLKPRLEVIHNKYMQTTIPFYKKKWLWAIAAAFITAIFSLQVLLNQQSSTEKFISTVFQVDPGLPTMMGITDNYEFADAMVDYKQQKYELAYEKWTLLANKQHYNDTLNYYRAIAALNASLTDSAIILLQQYTQNTSVYNYQPAVEYLCIALMKQGYRKDARQLIADKLGISHPWLKIMPQK